MKIIIQTGDVVTRKDVEELFKILPKNINSLINTFLVHASIDSNPKYQYHKKEKQFTFHSPQNSSITKQEAITGIAVHIIAALDIGHIPDKLSASKLQHYKTSWTDLCSSIT
jgi:hypothetical protein